MKQWFAVQTKPRQESLAETQLCRQGYDVYFPRIQQARHQRGRWRKRIEPLFPRYLFINLQPGRDNFAPIRSTFGVIDLVRAGCIPQPLPNDLIPAIRAREDEDTGVRIEQPQWRSGMAVELIDGPFAGIRGIYQAQSGAERVIILLSLLGQHNQIVVPRDAIIPA